MQKNNIWEKWSDRHFTDLAEHLLIITCVGSRNTPLRSSYLVKEKKRNDRAILVHTVNALSEQ